MKAHRDVALIDEPLERYRAIGNRMANDLANAAVRSLFPQVVQQFESMAQDIVFRRQRLHETLTLNIELQKFRAKHSQTSAARKGAHFTTDEVVQALSSWSPSIPVPLLDHYSTHWLPFSAWGGAFYIDAFTVAGAVAVAIRRGESTQPQSGCFMGGTWIVVDAIFSTVLADHSKSK